MQISDSIKNRNSKKLPWKLTEKGQHKQALAPVRCERNKMKE